ncbi:hypothetical protein HY972_03020 [Candidatus Kaiserbacteria bacterium]|nr:hypothetical protein [Candidatus Kaiserbacteria bacterium]
MSASPPSCRPLRDEEERRAAREIVRRVYEKQGYDVNSGSIARYLDGPDAATFGLFYQDALYATISVVGDGAQGLPMDTIYADELAPWRSEGKKLAEVVQFAVDHDVYVKISGKKPSPFEAAPLFAAVLSHALQKHIDYLCISINPKHDRFYGMLGFKQIGELKHYASVNAPAIARAFYVPDWKTHPFIASFMDKEMLRT